MHARYTGNKLVFVFCFYFDLNVKTNTIYYNPGKHPPLNKSLLKQYGMTDTQINNLIIYKYIFEDYLPNMWLRILVFKRRLYRITKSIKMASCILVIIPNWSPSVLLGL